MNILNLNYVVYLNFFMSLFVLVNPIGMIPIFTSMTNGFSYQERNKINLVANFSAFIILCVSLFLGHSILNLFEISISSFRIAGGILIILISLPMINSKNRSSKKNIFKKNIAVIPLAMPLISGPGTISSTILWSTKNPYFINKIICIFIILVFFCCCYWIFRIAPLFVQVLGRVGIEITTKVMGILLMSVGVEFIVSGIKCIF